MKYDEYIWQSPHWPVWRYDLTALADPMAAASRAQGLLLGRLSDVGLGLREGASLHSRKMSFKPAPSKAKR